MRRRLRSLAPVLLLASSCVEDPGVLDESGAEIAPAYLTFTPVPTGSPPLSPVDFTIKVYWHVIRTGPGLSRGDIPQSQIDSQIQALNDAFQSPSFRFQLESVDRTTSSTWYNATSGSSAEADMKEALWSGDWNNWESSADELNIYSLNTSSTLGWASSPSSYDFDPLADGIVVLYSSLPSGSAAPYNQGKTLVTLAGTWLGVPYVWAGGCTTTGDGISDTPAQASPAYGCPVGRNTCTSKPGNDPIENFMNYTDDACRTTFTAGQYDYMRTQWAAYRKDP